MVDDDGIADAMDYLLTGGLGEVWGLARISSMNGHHKVQMDTDLALALIKLAQEGLNSRKIN